MKRDIELDWPYNAQGKRMALCNQCLWQGRHVSDCEEHAEKQTEKKLRGGKK